VSIHSQYVTGRKEVIIYVFLVYKDQNIYSECNLCTSAPHEMDPVSLASVYSVTVLVWELVASPGIAAPYLATILNPAVVAAVASTYSLATEET